MTQDVAHKPIQAQRSRLPMQEVQTGDVDRTEQMQRMDRMYRYTRHVYDISRALYLPGRNLAIKEVAHLLPARGTLLEVGCGTGRNLRHVGRHRPDARLFGLDAASVMLRTARRACQRAGVRPTLCRGMAENVRPARFGVEGFDVILCSYLFSMLPQPVQALHAVLCSLKPGAYLVVVDFGTASALPRPLRGLLHRWLHLFGVAHRPSVSNYLHSQRAAGRLQLIQQQHVWGRYAELHVWRRPEQPLAVSAS